MKQKTKGDMDMKVGDADNAQISASKKGASTSEKAKNAKKGPKRGAERGIGTRLDEL